MNNKLIIKDNERMESLLETVEKLSETIENIVRNTKLRLGCEQYLTDREVSQILKISRRCLQAYRTNGKIPFYRAGGKILYRESDIENFLSERFTGI
ncbi:transcriptional regulator [Bacteroidia bacterium]|nr:transcriptional regulator [Bacteroidia bacterium]